VSPGGGNRGETGRAGSPSETENWDGEFGYRLGVGRRRIRDKEIEYRLEDRRRIRDEESNGKRRIRGGEFEYRSEAKSENEFARKSESETQLLGRTTEDSAGGAALSEFRNKTVAKLNPRVSAVSPDSKKGVVENFSEEQETKASKDLKSLTKDMRERKAPKADDAPVPMSIWEEHLIEDGTREWTKEERKDLGPACDVLRKRMLIWWKGKVSSSFREWLNQK
jgi:hypothetical protein